MNMNSPVIIFSVFTLDKSYGENKQNHDKVLDLLINNGISFKELDGNYNGQHELSILVIDTVDNRTIVNQLAMKYNQESILLLDSNRHAMLSKVISGATLALGPLLSSKSQPEALYWSFDKTTDTYFFT